MTTTRLRVAAAIAVPVLALSACSSGSSDSGGSVRPESAAKTSGSGAGGARGGGPADAAEVADTGTARQADATAPAIGQRSVISTGSVTLRAKDVAQARVAAQHVADTYAGEVADQETATGDDGRLSYARLVLRVPTASFAKAMADLEKVASLVDSSTTTEDVTTQVVDVDERVKAAKASIERIRLLMARAEKIEDVMAIESQLASREADLNSLLRQQAHLADQTSLSTISVGIERWAAHHARPAAHHSGFMAGLRGGWDALSGFGTVVATVVGALLPWLPVILLVGVPAWLVLRRTRRAAPPATPATTTES